MHTLRQIWLGERISCICIKHDLNYVIFPSGQKITHRLTLDHSGGFAIDLVISEALSLRYAHTTGQYLVALSDSKLAGLNS